MTIPAYQNEEAWFFVPDGANTVDALQRTTHLSIAAHPDDLEIMSYHAIARCFRNEEDWFTGVVVTDGSGGPRSAGDEGRADEQMKELRKREQMRAASMGEYSALVMLNYSSGGVKDHETRKLVGDLQELIRLTRPMIIYTHNPADRHDTHVAVVLRTIDALRGLDPGFHPQEFYGCEVWRSLDWLTGEDKIQFDAGMYPDLAASLLGVFDSQISKGKNYVSATLGRRAANATFAESHSHDEYEAVAYGMDLTPLIKNPGIKVGDYLEAQIDRFSDEVLGRIKTLSMR
jgi:LmbE family N-acetylglucosaminyl deacetylase